MEKDPLLNKNPLLNRPPNPKLDITIKKGHTSKNTMRKIITAFLNIIGIVSLVGIPYYFIPGFQHIGTQGTSWQPTYAFVCLVVFLVTVQFIPSDKDNDRDKEKRLVYKHDIETK